MQYAVNRHDGRLGWTNSLGGWFLNFRSVSSVLAATNRRCGAIGDINVAASAVCAVH
jgi:hypothetical protein